MCKKPGTLEIDKLVALEYIINRDKYEEMKLQR